MQKSTVLFLAILLIATLVCPSPGAAQTPEGGVVRAALFYSPTCPHCQQVIEEVLPPLLREYGDRLQIVGIDISQPNGQNFYQAAVNKFVIGPDRQGVPTMIIGDKVLVGADEIPQELPGLIKTYLSSGGVDWPAVPGLAEAIGRLTPEPRATPTAAPAGEGGPAGPGQVTPTRDPLANTIAIVVLLGMIVAVAYSVWIIALKGEQLLKPRKANPSQLRSWAIPLLALIGLGIASYLTYVKFTHTAAICGPVGDCDAVQDSPYSLLFGMPVALLGALSYLAVLFLWAGRTTLKGRPARLASLGLLGMVMFGTLFSIYLTYLEPFVIGAVCSWCLGSAVTMTGLLLVSTS
jgi:uncharacterized membrane protein